MNRPSPLLRLFPALALTIAGCQQEPDAEPAKRTEAPALKRGPEAPEPPIVASPIPAVPDSPNMDPDKVDGAKRADPRTGATRKDEPQAEPNPKP